jgi:hypothetical protein
MIATTAHYEASSLSLLEVTLCQARAPSGIPALLNLGRCALTERHRQNISYSERLKTNLSSRLTKCGRTVDPKQVPYPLLSRFSVIRSYCGDPVNFFGL